MERGINRTRWAAIGAAVAVTLGGGGLIGVSAAGVADSAALVTVDPVRILDTRRAEKVDDETYLLKVTGAVTTYSAGATSTATVVPAGASSVSLNLTVTEGVRNGDYGFVTAFPCTDASDTVPNASTINFVEGVDVANGVTVPLGADGEICLNVYGAAHLIADVSGYYTDSRLDDIEAEVDGILNAADGYVVGYSPVDWVASSLSGGCTATAPEYFHDHAKFWVPADQECFVVMAIDSAPWIGGVAGEGELRPNAMTVCREVQSAGVGNDVEVTELELFGLDTLGDGATAVEINVISPPTRDDCFLVTVDDHDRYPAYSLRATVRAATAGGNALDTVEMKEVTVGYAAD
jgi:hypothetical protein